MSNVSVQESGRSGPQSPWMGWILIAIGLVGVSGGSVWLALRGDPPATNVLRAVPADAQVVVTAELGKIRNSPYESMFRSSAVPSVMPGGDDGCGKNLADRIDTLVLWEPAEPGASFGVAALAPVSSESVWACARSTIEARGGRPAVVTVEGFRVISDDALGPGSAQIAVRDPGLLLLARPATRSRMMDALKGRTPSVMTSSIHAQMRRENGPPGDLTLTFVVSHALRDRVAKWLGEPTSLLDRVTGAAVAMELQTITHLRMTIWCETEGDCESLGRQAQRIRGRLVGSLALRAVGIAGLLDDMEWQVEKDRLWVRANAPAERVIGVLERLDSLDESWKPGASRVPMPPSPQPDETLRPVDSAGR